MKRICKNCDFREAAPNRLICYTCKTAIYSAKNPIRRIFLDLRSSAKKREIEFNITFDWFKKWISKTDYIEKRGRESHSLTIDRIEEGGGYTVKNIQVITKSENSEKYWEYYDRKRKEEYTKDMADVPF